MERAELARLLGAEPRLSERRDVVVAEADPARFIGAFAEAVAVGGNVFLADPNWSPVERAAFDRICALDDAGKNSPANIGHGWLAIPTGGSSGRLKLARHDQDTLAAAVAGFSSRFAEGSVNALGLLPLYHVSGLMAWLRCVLTGGAFLPARWSEIADGSLPVLPSGSWFLSLVPTQLQRLLTQPAAVNWLRGFRVIFVGGGPGWRSLFEAAREERLPIALSYGMTETAAMVCALDPLEFLAGTQSCGNALPHAEVTISEEGVVVIAGDSIHRGYFPHIRDDDLRTFVTEDCGFLDNRGHLQVTGRRDAVIITGGKKVDPLEVESTLRSTGYFSDVAVLGVPDPKWGEAVVACFPTADVAIDFAQVKRALEAQLSAYKHPKRFVALGEWPRNAQGKLNRAELRSAIEAQSL